MQICRITPDDRLSIFSFSWIMNLNEGSKWNLTPLTSVSTKRWLVCILVKAVLSEAMLSLNGVPFVQY